MAFSLTSHASQVRKVIDLTCRLDVGSGPAVLQETLHVMAAGGARKILLNLSGVSFKLTCVPKSIQELFQLSGLNRITDIHNREPDAFRRWGAVWT